VGKEVYRIKNIQRYTKTTIRSKNVPSLDDVEEIRAKILSEKVKSTIQDGHLGKYLHWVEGLLEEDYTSMDVAAALVKMMSSEVSNNK
jgi:ATP-dependent RNA helicase DeaD